MTHTITGTLSDASGATVGEQIVQLFAIEPGTARLLAEGLSRENGQYAFSIELAGGPSPAPARSLHFQVEVRSFTGAPLGKSEIRYNAGTSEAIDVIVQTPELVSEFERLNEALRRILPGQPLRQRDVQVLTNSQRDYEERMPLSFLATLTEQNLDNFRHAGWLAEQSGLEGAVFYGISKLLATALKTMAEVLALKDDQVKNLLAKAADKGFIPPQDPEAVLARLQELRLEQGIEKEQLLIGKLLDAATRQPLAGLKVAAFSAGAALTSVVSEDFTDAEGQFILSYQTKENEAPALGIRIYRAEELVHQVGQIDLQNLEFPLMLPPEPDTSPTLRQVREVVPLIPANVVSLLARRGVQTLKDFREKPAAWGGLKPRILASLKAHAALNLLGMSPAFSEQHIKAGFTSIANIASASRSDFIGKMRDQQGDFLPAKTWTQSQVAVAFTNGMITAAGANLPAFDSGTTNEDDAQLEETFEDILELFPESCGCNHCENAVSRTAYLADLLGYALQKVKIGETLVTLDDLQAQFHQPFGELPADCHGNHEKVLQVRICIGVLHAYLAAKNLPTGNAVGMLDAQYRQYLLDAYTGLLEQLNTSYEEIRDARTPDNDNDTGKQQLLQRLGLPADAAGTDPLARLYLAPENITEEELEQLFGLRNTRRPSLEIVNEIPLFLQWRKIFLRNGWASADHNPDVKTRLLGALPIIDPDLIGPDDLADPLAGPAADLWLARRDTVQQQLDEYRLALNNAADAVAAWAALFPTDSTLDDIREALPKPAASYLADIKKLIDEGNPIVDSEWQGVFNILAQRYKESLYESWRAEEAVQGIVLGPDFFKIPLRSFDFPAVEPQPRPAWRAAESQRRDWQDVLEGRIEKEETAINTLQAAVRAVEENTLPQLRDALVMATDAGGTALTDKAKWLTEYLLIDAQAAACHTTTRLQQATEAVQLLLWALRTGQMRDTHPDWTLDDEAFDGKWKWLGSYDTWRAAMLVFLFPENLLHPSMRREQTTAFREMVSQTRNNTELSPEDACRLAGDYSAYFEDVCNLDPQAAVFTLTMTYEDDCGRRVSKGPVGMTYLFARGRTSKNVYWSRWRGEISKPQLYGFWEKVPGLENVLEVLGATVYQISPEERFIYLFVKMQDSFKQKLQYVRYDLVNDRWEDGNADLELPDETLAFTGVVEQRNEENQAPQLAIRLPNGAIYRRWMNREGNDWAGEDWEFLVGSSKGRQFSKLCAMIDAKDGVYKYYLFVQKDNAVWYRPFGGLDDGQWRVVGTGTWVGGFPRGYQNDLYVFLNLPNATIPNYYQISYKANHFHYSYSATLSQFNGRIGEIAGLRLTDIDVNYKGQEMNMIDFLTLDYGGILEVLDYVAFADSFFDRFSETNIEKNYGKDWKWLNHLCSRLFSPIIEEGELSNTNLEGILRFFFSNRGEGHISQLMRISFNEKSSPSSGFSNGITSLFHASNPYGQCPVFYNTISNLKEGGSRNSFSFLIQTAGLELTEYSRSLATLRPLSNYDIVQKHSATELHVRKAKIQFAFLKHNDASKSLKITLEEAFYYSPIHLGIQLQRRGHYTDALDWYSSAYDYNAPPGQRKIYYGLIQEESISGGLERMADWLLDPLNPHSIAEARANTYTRFTLLTIIRCLIDYANAKFSRDTVESVPRARTLYMTALKLLEEPELRLQGDLCEQLLEELEAAVGNTVTTEYTGTFNLLQKGLKKLGNRQRVEEVSNAVKVTMSGPQPVQVRLRESKTILEHALAEMPVPASLQQRIGEGKNLMQIAQGRLIQNSAVGKAIQQAAERTAREFTHHVAQLSNISGAVLESEPVTLDWIGNGANGPDEIKKTQLQSGFSANTVEVPLPAFGFCVPDNPVIEAWKLEAELNLYKLRTCRNIEGLKRVLEATEEPLSIYSLPAIGSGGEIDLPVRERLQATPYRYRALLERAKQLVNYALQVESSMLSALEKRDSELYNLLKAGQDMELTRAGVRLNLLKVNEAEHGVVLAELQRDSAEIQQEYYTDLINRGLMPSERTALVSQAAAVTGFLGGSWKIWGDQFAQAAQANASFFQTIASFERRSQEWTIARNLARQGIRIGDQQIRLSEDRVRIVNQEHHISQLQADHAKETLDFLVNKFTNADLYDWMSGVLERIYSTFLQQATAVARLAEQQLAFERQQLPSTFIQSNYWKAPLPPEADLGGSATPNRRGLTGSTRLSADLAEMENAALVSDFRRQQLTKIFSLAQMSPVEFQLFRDSGVLPITIPMEGFDQDFPGHYHRLIKRVRVSVIALVPPIDGIKATLTFAGNSEVILGEPGFEKEVLRRDPEVVALTSPINATGQFEFELQQQGEMLYPFEGNGVAASWKFEMPKAANQFDYNTIADVLMTIDYTALYSEDYRKTVIQGLNTNFSADRALSFRRDFPDQWYDLNHPEQSNAPMAIQFDTLRGDFPANLGDLKLKQVVLYFTRKDGFTQEIRIKNLRFQPEGGDWLGGPDDQNLDTVNGILSTRSGSFSQWDAFINRSPVGKWALALPDAEDARLWFRNEQIEDVLIVLTFEGLTPAWPA